MPGRRARTAQREHPAKGCGRAAITQPEPIPFRVKAGGSCGSSVEAADRSRAQQPCASRRSASGLKRQAAVDHRGVLAPYKQEVACSSQAPPIAANPVTTGAPALKPDGAES